jgi:hypothetical protein
MIFIKSEKQNFGILLTNNRNEMRTSEKTGEYGPRREDVRCNDEMLS